MGDKETRKLHRYFNYRIAFGNKRDIVGDFFSEITVQQSC